MYYINLTLFFFGVLLVCNALLWTYTKGVTYIAEACSTKKATKFSLVTEQLMLALGSTVILYSLLQLVR